MEKNVAKTPETHSDELVEALRVICDIIIGPELRVIREYVTSVNESLSLDHANFGNKMESALATIREDAMAISADLRKTKLDFESDRKQWDTEITNISNEIQSSSEDLSKKISASENSVAANVTKFQNHMKTNLFNLTQEHTKRFNAIEGRLVHCEENSSALKEENMQMVNRLASAAQSLVTGAAAGSPVQQSSNRQVEAILNEIEESPYESANDSNSTEVENVDIDAVLNEV